MADLTVMEDLILHEECCERERTLVFGVFGRPHVGKTYFIDSYPWTESPPDSLLSRYRGNWAMSRVVQQTDKRAINASTQAYFVEFPSFEYDRPPPEIPQANVPFIGDIIYRIAHFLVSIYYQDEIVGLAYLCELTDETLEIMSEGTTSTLLDPDLRFLAGIIGKDGLEHLLFVLNKYDGDADKVEKFKRFLSQVNLRYAQNAPHTLPGSNISDIVRPLWLHDDRGRTLRPSLAAELINKRGRLRLHSTELGKMYKEWLKKQIDEAKPSWYEFGKKEKDAERKRLAEETLARRKCELSRWNSISDWPTREQLRELTGVDL